MTLQYLLRLFAQRKPKHLRVAVLLDKPERRIAAVHADYGDFRSPTNLWSDMAGLRRAIQKPALRWVLLLGPGLKKKPAED